MGKKVGLRELRQDASELVRRAQAGDEITITVSGRPSARLVPPSPPSGGGGTTSPTCSPAPSIRTGNTTGSWLPMMPATPGPSGEHDRSP